MPHLEAETASDVGAANRCFACESTNLKRISNVRDVHAGTSRAYDLQRCRACGSTRMEHIPSEEEFSRLYPDDYYSYVEPHDRLAFLKRLLGAIYRRHRYIPEFTSLLEIGPGRGEFLQKLSGRGNVVGLERSEAAHNAAAKVGVNVVVGDVANTAAFSSGAFDTIYSNHAFEHLPDPNAALRSIRTWLRPGGELFIGVPNIAGAVPRIFRKNWFYLGPPLHITNATPAGMHALLERHGFRLVRVVYNSDPISIPMSVFIAMGGRVDRVPVAAKLLIGLATFASYPITKLLDLFRAGDCIEIHAEANPT